MAMASSHVSSTVYHSYTTLVPTAFCLESVPHRPGVHGTRLSPGHVRAIQTSLSRLETSLRLSVCGSSIIGVDIELFKFLAGRQRDMIDMTLS